jgi:hypothetical protein
MRLLALLLVAAAPHVTHATLPVYVGNGRGHEVTTYEYSWGGGSAMPALRALKRPRRIGDLLPQPLVQLARLEGGDPSRSRRLLTAGGHSIYAFPGSRRQICFAFAPRGNSMCTPTLLDGALPQIRPGQDVWGIVDDGAVRVDVTAANRTQRAALGENAFYLALTAIPTRIVVLERNGDRHVFDVKRCTASFSPLRAPLSPSC